MADPKLFANPLFLTEEETRIGFDLLMLAGDALGRVAAPILADHGLARPHRRVLSLVGQRPGISLGELTSALGQPKQSVSRHIADLVDRTLVAARNHPSDGRRKALRLTAEGQALDEALWTLERREIVRAYKHAGAESVEGFKMVLRDLARPTGRAARAVLADGKGQEP